MGGKTTPAHQAAYRARDPERNYRQQKKHNDEKRAWVAAIKLERGCIDCGYNERPEALHFDHVRGEKLFPISTGLRSHSRELVLAEIEKCEVRCANCHAVKTRANKEHA